MKVNGVDYKKIFVAILLFVLEVFFLSYGTFIVYCTFTLKFISQIYTLLCKVSIFNLSDDITSYAPGELSFISRL